MEANVMPIAPKKKSHKFLIAAVVFLVILIVGTIIGFLLLSGKRKSNSCTPPAVSIDGCSGLCVSPCPTGLDYCSNTCKDPFCQPKETCGKPTNCKKDSDCGPSGSGKCTNGYCICKSPYKYNKDFKCVICDTSADCSGHGQCQPDGTCQCDAGWIGDTCNKQTTGCTKSNCNLQGGSCQNEKCVCKSSNMISQDGVQCAACATGFGPKFPDCSKKLFTNGVGSTNMCIDTTIHHDPTIDQYCADQYGPGANWSSKKGECHGDGDCSAASNHILCSIPKFYADPSYDPNTFKPCGTDGGEHDPIPGFSPA